MTARRVGGSLWCIRCLAILALDLLEVHGPNLSHTRNGIRGEMWAAGLCTASLAETSVDAVLDAADTVVPPSARLAASVRMGRGTNRAVADGSLTVDPALDRLHPQFAERTLRLSERAS